MSSILPASILFATTDLGESAVLAASATASALYLWFSGGRRAAIGLILAFMLAGAIISILKILFLSCAAPEWGILSPSGHTALSSAVFCTYAAIIGMQVPAGRRFVPLLVLLPLVAAIAITRVTLGAHTTGEVVLGLCVGVGVALLVYRMLFYGQPPAPFDVRVLIAVTLSVIIIFHDIKIPGEEIIHMLVAQIKRRALLCSM